MRLIDADALEKDGWMMQRKVLITITYNEMGIIIDTKAEEVAQPNLQPTCNQLATDAISRQAAIYEGGVT